MRIALLCPLALVFLAGCDEPPPPAPPPQVAATPAELDARENEGLALLAKGDFSAPGPIFTDILKEDPTRWKSLNAMGVLFITRNMQPEAQKYFTVALQYHPNDAVILHNIGLSQALEGRFGTAATSLGNASALAVGPDDRQHIDLDSALVYASAGHLSEARALAGQYLSGDALQQAYGLYPLLAKDGDLAKSYVFAAVTGTSPPHVDVPPPSPPPAVTAAVAPPPPPAAAPPPSPPALAPSAGTPAADEAMPDADEPPPGITPFLNPDADNEPDPFTRFLENAPEYGR